MSLVTTNLNEFDRRALNEASILLSQLRDTDILYDGDLQLKYNKNTHETFLSNGDLALVSGGNGHLHVLEIDDHSREFVVDSELRFGKDAHKCENAMAIRQELADFEATVEDYDRDTIVEAIKSLDQCHQEALGSLMGLSEFNQLDLDSISDQESVETMNECFIAIRDRLGAPSNKVAELLQAGLNELKVALEN